jgi:5-methylcytosine-specific restriction endonuclease McrA
MNSVLILNADYSPLQVAPLSTLNWKEAIKLVWLDQVEVLEYYDDWFVHSPSVTLQVPSVVVTKNYVKTSRGVKFNKTNLCIRDEYTCQYCQKKFETKSLTMEHVTPRSHGGKTNWSNIVMACEPCNTKKGNRLQMRPVKEPVKPSIGEILTKAKKMHIIIPDVKWIPYIGWPPRLVTVKNPQANLDFEDAAI